MVTRHATDGIPGSKLFLDHVHPTIEGNRLLALAIIDHMTHEGMVAPATTWNDSIVNEISENLVNGLDEKEHAMALRNLSKVLSWAGKEEEAERLINLAVDVIPEDSETHAQKGALLMQSGNMKAALEHYRESARLNPWNASTRHTYGVLLSKFGRIAESKEELEAAVKLDPTMNMVQYDLGIVLQSLGKLNQAETAYRAALEQDPDHAETYNNLGVVLAQRGNLKEAYENFVKALEIDPNNKDAASNLTRARKALK
jgi:Flp pilus assembly protein TadD